MEETGGVDSFSWPKPGLNGQRADMKGGREGGKEEGRRLKCFSAKPLSIERRPVKRDMISVNRPHASRTRSLRPSPFLPLSLPIPQSSFSPVKSLGVAVQRLQERASPIDSIFSSPFLSPSFHVSISSSTWARKRQKGQITQASED